MANDPHIIIFDIGGVLAEISKDPMRKFLARKCVAEHSFFDDAFLALQTGMITAKEFLSKKSKAHGVSEHELANVFCSMIDVSVGKYWLPRIKRPYVLFSNINYLHYQVFSQAVNLSVCAARFLSYEVGFLKPHADFFSALKDFLALRLSSTVYVDDKEENLAAAKCIGLQTAHCPSAQKLGEVLAKHRLI